MNEKHDNLLERIRLRLDESFVGIAADVAELAAPDTAELLNQLTLHEAAAVMSMLAIPQAAQLLDQPTLRRRSAIVEELEPGRAAKLVEALSSDQRTDIVRLMGEKARRRLLPMLTAEARSEVERLLRYPEHTAGGIMTTEFVRLTPEMSVGEALRHIRGVARSTRATCSRPRLDDCWERSRCGTW
jgi:magnesium transporter